MSEDSYEGPGLLDRGADTLTGIVNKFIFALKFTLYAFIIGGPFYLGWTWNQNLEREALKGVLLSPLEYKRDLFEIPRSGYKVQLVRITGKEQSLGETVYLQSMREEQLKAYGQHLEWQKRSLQEKSDKYDEIQEQKRVAKGRKAVKDIGDSLELQEDEMESLNETISAALGEQ